jgi:NAD(P)-dependent dehydrogenase (short-subunit alcohol dehydrogenase family)
MATSLKPLDQQTVVITGASSGIGLATARRAAREGANVVLVSRNKQELEHQVDDINAWGGGRAVHCAADVSEEGYAEKVGEVAKREFGGFDSWVNNAAAAMFGDLRQTSPQEHRQIFDTGYFGTLYGSLYAVRELEKRGGGALINVGSVLSDRAIQLQGVYCAMKHAVKGMTEALRMELERDDTGISVTLIKPNGMDTPYPEHARNTMDRPAALPPVLYNPELVAKAICFACAHPRRDLLVGGQGYLISAIGNLMPGTTDLVMEKFMGEAAQSSDTPPEPGAADNLFEPREDGRVRSNQDRNVRDTSLALEAQMHPVRTALVALGSIGVAAAALATARR